MSKLKYPMKPKVCAYVDGYNLYYGCLKDNPQYKWLDVTKFLELLLGGSYDIGKIKYFTARIKSLYLPTLKNVNATKEDEREREQEQKKERQAAYLRALKTHSRIEIIKGHYVARNEAKKVPEVKNKNKKLYFTGRNVFIRKVEEKGTDVNLAVHLLADAFRDRYDRAVVVSADTDLRQAIEMVKKECSKPVSVINPNINNLRSGLEKIADEYIPLGKDKILSCSFLGKAQLPNEIPIEGSSDVIKKPDYYNEQVEEMRNNRKIREIFEDNAYYFLK